MKDTSPNALDILSSPPVEGERSVAVSTGRVEVDAPPKLLPFTKRSPGQRQKLIPPLPHEVDYVFLIGRDPIVAKARQDLLRNAGYRVVSITPEEALKESKRSHIAISIFCHSLSSLERVQLAASFRRHSPAARLILMREGKGMDFEVMLFHRVVTSEESLDVLIENVRWLARTA